MGESFLSACRALVNQLRAPVPEVFVTVINLTQRSTVAEIVEVASTSAKRRKGLLGRTELEAGTGLLIRPCESVHTFAMRFPIDLVYLDRTHKVKKTRHAVQPWRISACMRAAAVLELPAGTVASTGTCPGDQLTITSVVPEKTTRDSSESIS